MAEDWLDALFREIEETIRLANLKKEHTYVEDLIRLLLPHRHGMSRQMVLHNLERQRRELGLDIPRKFVQSVQSAYNQNCSDSAVFRRRNLPEADAPFYTPGGKGSGKWAVNPERATAWLEQRKKRLKLKSIL